MCSYELRLQLARNPVMCVLMQSKVNDLESYLYRMLKIASQLLLLQLHEVLHYMHFPFLHIYQHIALK